MRKDTIIIEMPLSISRADMIKDKHTAAKYDGPVLLLHGDKDGIVPMWCSEKYAATYGDNARLQVVEGENHVITSRRRLVVASVVEFFGKLKTES